MEEGGSRNGDPASASGGKRRRRKGKRGKAKGRGGGSTSKPEGSRDAEGATAGADGSQDERLGLGVHGGRPEGNNGDAVRKKFGLGVHSGPGAGRNDGVEEESPPGGRGDGLRGDNDSGVEEESPAGGRGDGLRGGNGSCEHKKLGLGALSDQQVQKGDEQATGSTSSGVAAEEQAQRQGGNVKVQRSNGSGGGLDCGAVTRATGLVDSEGSKERAAATDTPWILESSNVDIINIKAVLNADKPPGSSRRQADSVAAVKNTSFLQHDGEGQGRYDIGQTIVRSGGDLGKNKASRRRKHRTKVMTTPSSPPSMLLPRRNFLFDHLLSWRVKDVLNHQLYEEMVVKKVPSKYHSAAQFINVQRGLLLEETRSVLCSALNNKAELQFCHLISVEQCESPCVYFLDIDLEMACSENTLCHHIAQDYDICILSPRALLDSSIDEMYCSLAIAVGIGRDTFYQRSFRVIVNPEKFQPERIKYVNFLPNIRFTMEIANRLSDEKDFTAIEAVLQLYKTVGRKCNSCMQSPTMDQEYPLGLHCLHKDHTDIIWAPPGTLKGAVAAVLEELLPMKPKVLVCLPSASSVVDVIADFEELSVTPDTVELLVINSITGLENCKRYEKFCLEHQSQELFCCLTQCEGSLRGMHKLLSLQAYYHTFCGDVDSSCRRCSNTTLLKFTVESIAMRFDAIIGPLAQSLHYMKNHTTLFSLLDQDTTRLKELEDNLIVIEELLHDRNLRVDYVEDSLVLAVDGASRSRGYTLAESLNGRRTTCMSLICDILDSLQLPLAEDRDMLDRFCIKNSRMIITTLDRTCQLHGLEINPFDLMIVHGAGQIREDELLVPLLLPVGHTLLLGDHFHLEPVIRSKICKEAGYGDSIFKKLERLVSKKEMFKRQYVMPPSIYQFPNTYFYEGKVKNGINVESTDYNREFIPLKFPSYAFMDIPATKMRPIRECYVYSAAILGLLQQFCEGMMNSKRKFRIAAVCMSSVESNIVRCHLRSKKGIHERIQLQVRSIDSLEEESFDVIILSMLLEDGTELKRVKENNLNVALTSSRHCLWIVGEEKALKKSGGIWKRLICDADKRGLVIKTDKDILAELTKQIEINNNGCFSNPNSAVSDKTTCTPGQEFTWEGRPYRTKYILANVRDQRGQIDTCTMQATLGVMVSIMKFRNAGLESPQEFNWDFLLDDLKIKYEKAISKAFLSEDKAERGRKRLETLFEILKTYGVVAINESKSKWREFKILGWERVDPTNTMAVKQILEQGGIMVGHFRVSKNYYNLKPGEIYVFDEDQALLNPRSDLPASHAVMVIGIGQEKIVHNGYSRHMAMQNSEGRIFGVNGIGRVGENTVGGLYRIRIREMKRSARGGA